MTKLHGETPRTISLSENNHRVLVSPRINLPPPLKEIQVPGYCEISDYRVILAATSGRVSGVDVFSFNLVRGLLSRGIQAHIVMTEPYLAPPDPMPYPPDIPVRALPVSRRDTWRARWRVMIRYLEDQAPCIYIPNYDWRHSCVSPKLSKRVHIVGIVHSDDPLHYEHVKRLGRYWNAVVAVSSAIEERVVELVPSLASRVVTVPYGIEPAAQLQARCVDKDRPLKVVYAGRLVQEQKRVLDLPGIAAALACRGVPVELTIIGGGEDGKQLLEACRQIERPCVVNFPGTLSNERVLEVFGRSDVFILTSEYEGLPVSLLEAMGQGCVPVVADVRSGVPELIRDSVNGCRVPVGDIQAFADRLEALYYDAALRDRLASQAYDTICASGYRTEEMVQSYLTLFKRVAREAASGSYRRPKGKVLPPPSLAAEVSLKKRLLVPVRAAGRICSDLLHGVCPGAGRQRPVPDRRKDRIL